MNAAKILVKLNGEDTKNLYAEVYKTEGHNYGEVKDRTNIDNRPNEQLVLVKRLIERIKLPMDSVVVEIGCGLGHLHACHKNWMGFEYSTTAVDLAKNIYGKTLKIEEGDARSLPLPSNSVDFLFSFAALEHIPEVEKAFAEIERVLKPNAIALLSPAWNCRPWTVKKLEQRPYSELTVLEKIGKLLIPVRNNLIVRMLCAVPFRMFRELSLLISNKPLRLQYKKLQPNFTLWEKYPHISDDDAFVNIDAHAAMTYFLSRKWTIESHNRFIRRFGCRGEEIVVRKPT